MEKNIEKYEKDLKDLIQSGARLLLAMQEIYNNEPFRAMLKLKYKTKEKISEYIKKLPSFSDDYQTWYSESLVLVKQLLPDRILDFTKLYEKPKARKKEITHENYVIEDALQGLIITRGFDQEVVTDPKAAIPKFFQQLNIIRAVEKRFESSLFDIKQLIQADLFDTELEAAKELNKKGFIRGAGAIAGVILEKHLSQVCDNHNIKKTKNSTISIYNDSLKEANVYEIPTWRKIQYLTDLRNLCDHEKEEVPKVDNVDDLIKGVDVIVKTIF